MAEKRQVNTDLMKKFLSESWEKTSKEDRLAYLRQVENEIAQQEGRKARTIIAKPMEKKYGYFSRTDPDVLYINESFLEKFEDNDFNRKKYNSYSALMTLFHEGRHAYQHDAIQKDSKIKISEAQKSFWTMNDLIYYTDKDFFGRSAYLFQPLEEDAELFALDQLYSMADIFCGDSQYREFLDNQKLFREADEREAEIVFETPDFRTRILKQIIKEYNARLEDEDAPNERAIRALSDNVKGKEKRPPLQMILFGVTVLLYLLVYLFSQPHGLFKHLLWIVSALTPLLPIVLWARLRGGLPEKLRGRRGGIFFLALFAVLLLLVRLIYKWLFIGCSLALGILIFKTVIAAAPNTLTIIREEEDGTTSTETRILGDETAAAEIAAAESQLRSEGYTVKK